LLRFPLGGFDGLIQKAHLLELSVSVPTDADLAAMLPFETDGAIAAGTEASRPTGDLPFEFDRSLLRRPGKTTIFSGPLQWPYRPLLVAIDAEVQANVEQIIVLDAAAGPPTLLRMSARSLTSELCWYGG
jgi:hypothetical protein